MHYLCQLLTGQDTSHTLPLLGPRGEVFVAIENLTDRRYALHPSYPMPGLSGRLGVNLSL